MARMQMPKNADGEYVYDHNQYLKAAAQGLIRKGSDDRIFIGTFVAAAKVKAGKAYEKTLRNQFISRYKTCLLYTSPSPRDATLSRMPSSA